MIDLILYILLGILFVCIILLVISGILFIIEMCLKYPMLIIFVIGIVLGIIFYIIE